MHKILVRLCVVFFPHVNSKLYLLPYISLIRKYIKHYGIIHTIKMFKRMRLHCTRYICGQPLFDNNMSIGIDKWGWPKALHFLKPLADKGEFKFLFTILMVNRSLNLSKKEWEKVEPNLSTITDPPKGNYIIPSGFINKFVKQFRLFANPQALNFDKSKIYLSLKAGPNGPATLTAQEGLLAYNYPTMQNILDITDVKGADYFCSQYKFAFEQDIRPMVPSCRDDNGNLFLDEEGREILGSAKQNTSEIPLGRISTVQDPEAKLRVIAIVDYYTQLFLRPIHDELFKLIKKLPCDRSFTQNPRHTWVEDDSNCSSYWSLDLSSATDRFPIALQRRLLTRIFKSSSIASAWESLLSKRDFHYPNRLGDTQAIVRYNTGQPMGSYSSWIAFTLSHHLVVHYCAYLHGIHNFNQYIILGDDIVIKHDEVAKTYIRVMEAMGVELSLAKTHCSKNTYEFAKRWFKDGVEITGIPTRGIVENFKNPFIVYTILYDFYKIKKNQYLSMNSLVGSIASLYKGFLYETFDKKKKNYVPILLNVSRRTLLRLEAFNLVMDRQFGYYTYDALRRVFAKYITNEVYSMPGPEVALSELDRILGTGMTTTIANSVMDTINLSQSLLWEYEEVEDKNICINYPIFQSILNYVKDMWEVAKSFDSKETTLMEASHNLVHLDISSVFSKERNVIRPLMKMGTMFNKGFSKLNETDEIWYGSSWTESSYTAPQDLVKLISQSYKLDDLLKIEKGEWKASMTAKDAEQAYEMAYLQAWSLIQ